MRHHHAIHLGAAWEPPAPTVAGREEWTRRFGKPAGLAAGDRVLLVVRQPGAVAAVRLNDVFLSPPAPGAERWEADVTSLLRDRNELRLVVDAAAARRVTESAGRGPLPAACGIVSVEIVSCDQPAGGTTASRCDA